MPTFLFFKDGEKVKEVVGANPKAIEAAIKATFPEEEDAQTIFYNGLVGAMMSMARHDLGIQDQHDGQRALYAHGGSMCGTVIQRIQG